MLKSNKIFFRLLNLPIVLVFVKSEFFVLNALKTKAYIRKQKSTTALVDTFSNLFSISLKSVRQLAFFSQIRQFFFLCSFHCMMLVRFFDLLPYQKCVTQVFSTNISHFRYPLTFVLQDLRIVERVFGGYLCVIYGKFCFLSFNTFLCFQKIVFKSKINFLIIPKTVLKITCKRKLRRNAIRYKKAIRRPFRFLENIKDLTLYSSADLNLHLIFLLPKVYSRWLFFECRDLD